MASWPVSSTIRRASAEALPERVGSAGPIVVTVALLTDVGAVIAAPGTNPKDPRTVAMTGSSGDGTCI